MLQGQLSFGCIDGYSGEEGNFVCHSQRVPAGGKGNPSNSEVYQNDRRNKQRGAWNKHLFIDMPFIRQRGPNDCCIKVR